MNNLHLMQPISATEKRGVRYIRLPQRGFVKEMVHIKRVVFLNGGIRK